VAWGRLAEICGEFLIKGARAYAEGRLQTRKYDDRGGIERTVCEVVVRQLRFLGGPGNGNGKTEQRACPAENPDADVSDEIPF
jgi:single-strand DNA-binding protein